MQNQISMNKSTLVNFYSVYQSLIPVFLLAFSMPQIINAQCNPDIEPPTLVCDAEMIISLPAQLPVDYTDDIIEFGIEALSDNCSSNFTYELSLNGEVLADGLWLDCDLVGEHTLLIQATDEAGNSNLR